MNRLSFITFAIVTSCTGASTPTPTPAPTPDTADASPALVSSDAGSVSTAPDSGTEPSLTKLAATATACPTPAQLSTDLAAASQASVISLSGINPLACPEVAMTQTWTGGKLIFSDSPESPSVRAKLYEDTGLQATSGTNYNRIYVYHVNGKASGKGKFTVLIKNNGSTSATLTIQKKGISGPTTNYLYAGKVAFQRWLDSTAGTPVSIPAGSTVQLDTSFEVAVNPSNLMHGIWDYSMTQAHTVTVCALNQSDAPLTVCPGLAVASRDPNHQRGTFPNADKVYDTAAGVQVDTVDGIQQFPIAGNTANDSNASGIDATDGSAQVLVGNYGVLYRMHLNVKTSDSKNFGFLLNPRGGAWGGAVWAVAGITPGGKFLIPPTTGSVSTNTNAAVEGKYAPGAGMTAWLQFMPTGGSSFPLRFVVVPY